MLLQEIMPGREQDLKLLSNQLIWKIQDQKCTQKMRLPAVLDPDESSETKDEPDPEVVEEPDGPDSDVASDVTMEEPPELTEEVRRFR